MLPAVSGSAPCPQDPGHGGIQGVGVSGVLVRRSVGRLLREGEREWRRVLGWATVLVGALGRVGFLSVVQACSSGQVRKINELYAQFTAEHESLKISILKFT